MKKWTLLILLLFTTFTVYSQVVIMPARTMISTPSGGQSGSLIESLYESLKSTHPAYADCCDYPELNNFYDDYCQELQYEAFANLGDELSFYDEKTFDYINEEDLFEAVRTESIKFQASQGLFPSKKIKQTGKEIGENSHLMFEKSQVKYIVYTVVIALKQPSKFYEKKENEFLGNLGAYAWIVDCATGMIVAEAYVRSPTESSYSSITKTTSSSSSPKYSRINQSDYKRINRKINSKIKRKLNRFI